MDCSPPGSSVHGISKQEYWSGLPFSTPGDLPNPGIQLASLKSPAFADRFFTTSATWEAIYLFWTKDTKRQKKKIAQLKGLEQKLAVESKSRILNMPSAHETTRGVGKLPKPPLLPDPWTHPYPYSI